ncbi:MAG: hypothetical protein ABFS45_13245 [Pseudomonadota bacterium]
MKRTTILTTLTFTIVCGFYAVTTLATEPPAEVHINIHPGSNPNIINPDSNGVIPVMIFGSRELDVTKIDPLSLKLEVNFLWCSSSVETTGKHAKPLCDIRDDGSPNDHYFDGLGPPDGYDDLICQFNNELGLIREAIQPVTLTGIFSDGGGNGSPLFGTDFASGPVGTEAISRCCINCDNGNCGGCNGDIRGCTDLIRICDGKEICRECTGCKRLPDVPIS